MVVQIHKTIALDPVSLRFDNAANSALLPQLVTGAVLEGEIKWQPKLVWTQLVGVDDQGFYLLREGASLGLELTAEPQQVSAAVDVGTVRDGFELELAGNFAVPDPLSVTLLFWPSVEDRIRTQTLIDSTPKQLVGITADGQAQLVLDHRLEPLGLEYDGRWEVLLENGAAQQQRTPQVDFPTGQEYYERLIGWFADRLRPYLDENLEQAFSAIALPFADAASGAGPLAGSPEAFGSTVPARSQPQWYGDVLNAATDLLQSPNGIAGNRFVTEGDELQRSAHVRGLRSVDGTGVKVGILASGAEGLELVRQLGEVPAGTQVYAPAGHRGGSGTAMAEVVHDVAPGAALFVGVPPTGPRCPKCFSG